MVSGDSEVAVTAVATMTRRIGDMNRGWVGGRSKREAGERVIETIRDGSETRVRDYRR